MPGTSHLAVQVSHMPKMSLQVFADEKLIILPSYRILVFLIHPHQLQVFDGLATTVHIVDP